MISDIAPAKINLYLHIGPLRDDGLHDLASLFVFTEMGDVVSVKPADDISLAIEGPFARALAPFPIEDNLVYRAALALRAHARIDAGAHITLEKNLPIAAGIGGGSADAAAALRALQKLWRVEISDEDINALAFSLGADVPACLTAAPVLVDGAGERLSVGPCLPALYVCLVNPGVEMPTGPVFRRYDADQPNPPAPTHPAAGARQIDDAAGLIASSRNDLEAPACAINPAITALLTDLAACDGVIAARMSGSGATCFGLFAEACAADEAASYFAAKGLWALASPLASG